MPHAERRLGKPAHSRIQLGWPHHAAALVLYALLSLLCTWPLAAHLTTHMPGDGGDDPALAWNLWWVKHRLVDQLNLDIFHVDYMFYPIEINLAFYTLTPLNGLLSVPLQTSLTLLLANNLVLLSTFVLGGYGMFLLALYLLGRTYAMTGAQPAHGLTPTPIASIVPIVPIVPIALAAGVFYAFASSKLFYPALGQFNIASSHWIPFCALYLLRTMDATRPRARYRAAGLAALFLVLQAWSELTYASFLIIFAAIVFAWWLVALLAAQNSARRAQLGQLFTSGLLLVALFTVGISPFLAAMLPDMRMEGDFFGEGGGFADIFSADLMGYLWPTLLHPWFGEWASRLPFPNDKGQHIYVGYTLLALSAVGIWAHIRSRSRGCGERSRALFWTLCAVLFFLLTLGPNLRWAGNDLPIVGPFEWISRLPFFSGNRYPSRYSVMLMLSVAALAALGLAWLSVRLRTRVQVAGLLCGIVLLFGVEHLSAPLPLNNAQVPAIYHTLAQIPGDFAVLELPTGWRNGARIVGRLDQVIMMQQWYQTAHEKRRLGGNTSRNPLYKFQYFTYAPLLGDLIALMNADRPHLAQVIEPELDALIARHRPTSAQVLHDLGVRYVLLHTETKRTPPALARFVQEALPLTLVERWDGLDWKGEPSGILLYAVNPPALSASEPPRTVDLTTEAANLYLAEGWSARYAGARPARLAQRNPIQLLLPAPAPDAPAAYRFRLDPAQTRLRQVTGQHAAASDLAWHVDGDTLTVTLPPSTAVSESAAMHRISLTFDVPLSLPPPDVRDDDSALPVGATGHSLEPHVSVLARSAGEEVGDFAEIYVNGRNVAPNRIGYNLAALLPNGELLGVAAFNTHGDPDAAAAMATWLDQWPDGTLIAGAVADEGSLRLTEQAVDALRRLGCAVDLRDHFRWSHAFIGATGAPPNSALERHSLLTPAAVGVGIPQDAPSVYGLFAPR